MLKSLLYALTLITFSSCALFKSSRSISPRNLLDQHDIRSIDFWKDQNEDGTSLADKLQKEVPSKVQDFINIWHQSKQIPQNQQVMTPLVSENEFPAAFKQALDSLPPHIQESMKKRLKGIYLVDGIGASIFTLQLKDKNGPINQFVAFCDKKILNQSINDWYKWRELTAFSPQTPYDIIPKLSQAKKVTHTIQYAALQLYAIMLSFDEKFYPSNQRNMVYRFTKYPFLQASWKIENEALVSAFNKQEAAHNLSFMRDYSQDRSAFTLAKLSDYYAFVEKTNFINFYAFMGPSRDFVESIANFLYVEKLNNPFEVTFKRGNKTLRTFKSCWKQKRCLKKRRVIEKLLQED